MGDCEQTMTGHTSIVNSAAFSPDGLKVVSGGSRPDNSIRIWSVATGECERTIMGHSGDVNSVSFSPDGRQIVFASGDHTIRV
jgi:WD40 repeat protein